MSLQNIFNCCSGFLDTIGLQKGGLRFIPALGFGLLVSFLLILYLYKKQTKKGFFDCLLHLLKDIFVSVPSAEHSEFMKCNNHGCVRCAKSDGLISLIIIRWNNLKIENKCAESIDETMQCLMKYNKLKALNDKERESPAFPFLNSSQKPSIFGLKLASNSIWTDFNAYQVERELLKVNFNIIKEEYLSVFAKFQLGKTDGWKTNQIPSGHWCFYPLIDQGIINERNCQECPNTSSLLNCLPSVMKDCVFGNASFSLLYPDSVIETHCGPTNIRLRCHFGLSIPGDCYLEVDGKQYRWKEGESLIFDDSYRHSAFFAKKKEYHAPRVILLIDFWHVGISEKEKSESIKLLKP